MRSLGFAYNNEQFIDMMEKWGLCHGRKVHFPTKNDISQIRSIGAGGYVRKKDVDAMKEMFSRHEKEMKDAFDSDPDGLGFIKEAFRYELDNHEYSYTRNPEDAMLSLGLTCEDVFSNDKLLAGYKAARDEILEETY